MTTPSKDTIYVDVDDEITGIIDKVRDSKDKVVALVLPKRAATLQSIVNMKLLKRTAETEKKNLVLITSEAGLLPLAGRVGLHVAKTLQSKPEIPSVPDSFDSDTDTIDEPVDVESEPANFDPKEVADKPVGELAGLPPTPTDTKIPDDEIDLGSMAAGAAGEEVADTAGKKKKKDKKDKKLKVPNFSRFRKILLLGGVVLIALIIGLVLLLKSLPKATITIQTTNSTVKSSLSLTLDTGTKTFDPTTTILPATAQQATKTNSQQVNSTGQKNNGTPATGTISLSGGPCSGTSPSDVGVGVGLSISSVTFITQNDTSFSPVVNKGNKQCTWQASNDTQVTAQNGGTGGNNLSSSCSIPSRDDVTCSVTGTTSGGTDNILKIVAQSDIDNASKQLSAQDTTPIKQGLQTTLQQAGLYAVPSTFSAGTPTIAAVPPAGTQSATVTVSQTVIYSMLGIHQGDLETLIKNAVNLQIDKSKQDILNDGVSAAVVTVQNQGAGKAQVSVQSSSLVGVSIDATSIKKQVVGKKSGEIQGVIKAYPGVSNVLVHFSPFYVTSAPSNLSKITLIIKNAN